jgi:glycosyltransferase involved in cell wall biosynthesis
MTLKEYRGLCYTQEAMRPVISVVIPTKNEEACVGACLESLRRQVYEGDYEIIVVDSSRDRTPEICRQHGARVVAGNGDGVAAARAAGFTAASGDIIASTDADTLLPPGWLARIAGHFTRPEVAGVGGLYEYFDGPPSINNLVRGMNRIIPHLYRAIPATWSLSGFNFAVRKSAYAACGGFDTRLRYGEDWNLGRRLQRVGKVILDPELFVTTSGMAFADDSNCLRPAANYACMVFFGKALLPPPMRTSSRDR